MRYFVVPELSVVGSSAVYLLRTLASGGFHAARLGEAGRATLAANIAALPEGRLKAVSWLARELMSRPDRKAEPDFCAQIYWAREGLAWIGLDPDLLPVPDAGDRGQSDPGYWLVWARYMRSIGHGAVTPWNEILAHEAEVSSQDIVAVLFRTDDFLPYNAREELRRSVLATPALLRAYEVMLEQRLVMVLANVQRELARSPAFDLDQGPYDGYDQESVEARERSFTVLVPHIREDAAFEAVINWPYNQVEWVARNGAKYPQYTSNVLGYEDDHVYAYAWKPTSKVDEVIREVLQIEECLERDPSSKRPRTLLVTLRETFTSGCLDSMVAECRAIEEVCDSLSDEEYYRRTMPQSARALYLLRLLVSLHRVALAYHDRPCLFRLVCGVIKQIDAAMEPLAETSFLWVDCQQLERLFDRGAVDYLPDSHWLGSLRRWNEATLSFLRSRQAASA